MARSIEGLDPSALRAADGRADLNINVVRSCIDTVIARISVNRPRIQFLTSGGDWQKQQKAKQATNFIDGLFAETQAYFETTKALRDALIFGTGFVKVYLEDGRVKIERVFKPEVFVDEASAITCRPRSLYQRKWISSDFLTGLYPRFAAEIEMSAVQRAQDNDSSAITTSMVQVVEAWHLPSSEKAKDGRHVIGVNEASLLDEKWELSCFPFAEVRWAEPPIGFFGQGGVEEIEGLQDEITALAQKVQRAMRLGSVLHVLAERNSKVALNLLNNEDGSVIEYDQQAPQVFMPDAVSGQVVQHMWALEQKAYNIFGISQMSARSDKPEGDISGAALRTLQDVETQRFGEKERAWERLHVDLAQLCIKMIRRAAENNEEGYAVNFKQGKSLEKINWREVELPDEDYDIEVYPTSMLPKEPAGRMAMVQEWIGAGMVDQVEGKRLLDFPDLDQHYNLDMAAVDNIHFTMDEMLYRGRYQPPDPMQDLEYGLRAGAASYLHGLMHNAPRANLDKIASWLVAAKEIIAARMPAPPALPGMAPMSQPGMPGAEAGLTQPVPSLPMPVSSGGAGVPPELQPK